MLNYLKFEESKNNRNIVRLLENADFAVLAEQFRIKIKDTIKKDIDENGSDGYSQLYKKLLDSSTYKDSAITESELKLLDYVLKYNINAYSQKDVIFETDENVSGQFNLLDPGYYLFELSGKSGLSNKNKKCTNFLTQLSKWKTSDGLATLVFNTDVFSWALEVYSPSKGKNLYYYGRYEINYNSIFFFLSDNFENDKSGKDEGLLSNALSIANNTYYNVKNLYDYTVYSFDPLDSSSGWCLLKFSYNNYEFLPEQVLTDYDNIGTIKSFTALVNNSSDVDNNITSSKYSFFTNKIKSQLANQDLHEIKYRRCIQKANDEFSKIFDSYNYLHGGDAGHIYAIVKLNEDDSRVFHYQIGDTFKGCKVFNNSNTLEIFSEDGSNVDASGLNFADSDKRLSSNMKDYSSHGTFTSELNTHVGEPNMYAAGVISQSAIDHFYNCGSGKSYISVNGQKVVSHSFGGGGSLGEGVRLNEFGVAYYQPAEKRYLKITFLGSDIIKTLNFKTNNSSGFQEKHMHYVSTDEPYNSNIIKIPYGSDFPVEYVCTKQGNNIVFNLTNDNVSDIKVERKFNRCNFIVKSVVDDVIIDSVDTSTVDGYILDVVENKDDSGVDYAAVSSVGGEKYSNKTSHEGFNTWKTISAKFASSGFDYDLMLLQLYNTQTNRNTLFDNDKVFIDDSETFDSVKRTTTLNLQLFKNFRLFQTLKESLQLSVSIKNKLDLPNRYDHNGSVIEGMESKKDATITKIEYCKIYPSSKKGTSYVFDSKINTSTSQRFFFKFTFSSERLELDRGVSNFPAGTIFYDVGFDLSTNQYVEDSEDSNFQWVSFIMPNTSFQIQAFVKIFTYSIRILKDLYNEFDLRPFEDKYEFEYKEEVCLSFKLDEKYKVSTLSLGENTSTSNPRKYQFISEKKSVGNSQVDKFKNESFICIGSTLDLQNNFTEFEIYNQKLLTFLSLKAKNSSNKLISFYCEGSRNDFFNESPSSLGLKPLYASHNLEDAKKIFTETEYIYFSMKKNDISIRLTSDYLPFKKLVNTDNGDSTSIKILKPYCFYTSITGGPSGDGGTGKDGELSSVDGYNGGFGGDGYIGGNGGNGGNTTRWTVGYSYWHGTPLISDLDLRVAPAGHKGYGGNGFLLNGGNGVDGTTTIFDSQYSPTYNTKLIKPTKYPYYTGARVAFPLKIQSSNASYTQMFLYCICGRKGQNGLDGLNSGDMTSGQGGACGSPTIVQVYPKNDAYIKRLSPGITKRIFSDWFKNGVNENTQFEKIFVSGGLRGQSRGFVAYRIECTNMFQTNGGFKVWSLFAGSHSGTCTSTGCNVRDNWNLDPKNTHKNINVSTSGIPTQVEISDIYYDRIGQGSSVLGRGQYWDKYYFGKTSAIYSSSYNPIFTTVISASNIQINNYAQQQQTVQALETASPPNEAYCNSMDEQNKTLFYFMSIDLIGSLRATEAFADTLSKQFNWTTRSASANETGSFSLVTLTNIYKNKDSSASKFDDCTESYSTAGYGTGKTIQNSLKPFISYSDFDSLILNQINNENEETEEFLQLKNDFFSLI